MAQTEAKAGFESRLQSVQDIIQLIEDGHLSLEDAVKQYEKGILTLKELENELNEMNRKITILQDGAEAPEEKPFSTEGI